MLDNIEKEVEKNLKKIEKRWRKNEKSREKNGKKSCSQNDLIKRENWSGKGVWAKTFLIQSLCIFQACFFPS